MSEENYMRIIDLRGKKLTRAEMLEAMPRAEMGTNEATELVQPILDDVKARGAAALRDFAEKFDHIRPEHLRVPVEAMKAAVDELDPEVRAAIEESVRRCRAVSASQVPAPFHTTWPKARASPNVGFRCSASACTCREARPSTRAPSS